MVLRRPSLQAGHNFNHKSCFTVQPTLVEDNTRSSSRVKPLAVGRSSRLIMHPYFLQSHLVAYQGEQCPGIHSRLVVNSFISSASGSSSGSSGGGGCVKSHCPIALAHNQAAYQVGPEQELLLPSLPYLRWLLERSFISGENRGNRAVPQQ